MRFSFIIFVLSYSMFYFFHSLSHLYYFDLALLLPLEHWLALGEGMADDYCHVALAAHDDNDVMDAAYTYDNVILDDDTYNSIHSNSNTAHNRLYVDSPCKQQLYQLHMML